MNEALSTVTFATALVFYGGASVLFYFDVARQQNDRLSGAFLSTEEQPSRLARLAPWLLLFGALGHGAYVVLTSFIAHVCPIHSVHFLLSVASLFSIATYLLLRRRFRIGALGLLVSPLGVVFLLGTYFLGKPTPEPKLDPLFITLHVLANMVGIALFLLAGLAAALYLLQERRIKGKKLRASFSNLPPLETLDKAIHRFLVAGFPLLTLGIVTGTYWAKKLETGSPDEVMRTLFGYATWLLIAGVLLLRAAAGWRGRRAAYGTIAGLFCAACVLVIYLIRPAMSAGAGG